MQRRPLPVPPQGNSYPSANVDSRINPHPSSYQYPPYTAGDPYDLNDPPTTSLRGGTLLHKGFYDLLAMIPTPSPSRFFWAASSPTAEPVLAGPRYEDISQINDPPPVGPPPAPPAPSPLRKPRRISKDMVSHPTGFVYVCNQAFLGFCKPDKRSRFSHLVHASDADQLEALLTRWGPDGLGKLGGQCFIFPQAFVTNLCLRSTVGQPH
jgi:protein-serine/threonine kinase